MHECALNVLCSVCAVDVSEGIAADYLCCAML